MHPADTAAPATSQELAEVLAACSAERRPVVPLGAGAHQHHGAPPPAGALPLSTAGLARLLEYTPADLTVTVEAGMPLAALQAELARHGQWLPWDPPGAGRATVGGLLAAGLSGPLRLARGTPRDWVLGMRVALGDGRLVKSGGRVVKNVAGYDTHKLHIGALGTLGVICEVTFKLAPRPERAVTLSTPCPDRAAALALAEAVRARPLSPASLALWEGAAGKAGAGAALLMRFAGVPAAVERQLHEARSRAAGLGLEPHDLGAPEADAAWLEVSEFPTPRAAAGAEPPAPDTILRAAAPPSSLAALAEALGRHQPAGARTLLLPGVGLAYARWPAGESPAGRLAALRGDLGRLGGYAVVEHAPAAPQGLDIWGPAPETVAIMRRLKAQWDPARILNPGRYIDGI